MGSQNKRDFLAISLGCAADMAVGTLVELAGPSRVQAVSVVGSANVVGQVVTHHRDQTTCVVETSFARHRFDRLSGRAVAVGPFVWGPAATVWPYMRGSAPRLVGTTTGTISVGGSTDKIKIAVGDGDPQTVTLSHSDTTLAAVAAEITAAVYGAFAYVDHDGHLVLRGELAGGTFELQAVTNDAYTALGWVTGTYSGAIHTSGGAAKIVGDTTGTITIVETSGDKFKIAVGGAAPVTVTILDSVTTLANAAAAINAAVTGAFAYVDGDGHLCIAGENVEDSLQLETVSGDAYTALGLTVGTYLGTQHTHDPSAVAGLVLTPATAAGQAVETLEL